MKKEEYKTKEGFDIRLEARLKNAKLIGARELSGLSAKKIAERLGISYATYLNYESMKSFPNEEMQTIICDFYSSLGIYLDEKDVFPEELRNAYFKRKYIAEKSIPKEKLISLSVYDRKLLPVVENEVEAILEEEDIKQAIDIALSERLTYREQQIVRMYFGIGEEEKDLDEIARDFNLSTERIRQIKEKAVGRLRHSRYSEALRQYL